MYIRRHVHRVIALVLLPACWFSSSVLAQEAVPTRDAIPDNYKWDLTTIYPDVAAWEADFARVEEGLSELREMKDKPWTVARGVFQVLIFRDNVKRVVDKLLVYAHMRSDEDTRDNAVLALKDRAAKLHVSLGEASAWIEPANLAIKEDNLKLWRTSNWLYVHLHYLANVIRQKEHTLSAREEELLAMAGGLAMNPDEIYSILKNSEMRWPTVRNEQGEEVVLSPARLTRLIESRERRVRRDAFTGAMETFAQYQNTFAATLSGTVRSNLFYAKARGFETPLEARLYPDNLPTSVFTGLVDTIAEHLPLLHRWAALRKKVLGLDELHVYDLYNPLAEGGDQDVPYDRAVETIIAALQPLGPEYCQPMEQGFASRWIDVYETQGKRPGGYSSASFDTHPFILLNYNGTPREVSTIAHEMGHAMHSLLSNRNQPPVNAQYSSFVAEVASIFNEILLEEHLLSQAKTPEERLPLLNQQIDGLRATVFRQVMFAEFEYQANLLAQQGESLTAERLNKLYLDTFHKYWGPELARDGWHGVYWARIPHFYMNHYVYHYASSYCAAAALAEGVLAQKEGALDAYLGFLKAGSSDYPLEILRKAGVDMTTPGPIKATMRRFERLVDELEKLLAQ